MTMMTRHEPGSSAMPLRDAMEQLFRDSFVVPFGPMATTSRVPVDVYETKDAFVVKASMPGLTADELTISVQQQTVTIHGEPKAEELTGLRPLLQERRIGPFDRTFGLPLPVDSANVQAELSDGVLSLTLPKSEAAKPRKIQVKSS